MTARAAGLRVEEPPLRFTAEASFDFASPAYRDLCVRAGVTGFQRAVWLDSFYRHLAGASAEPLVVAGYGPACELRLVVPLLRRRSGDAIRIEYAFGGVTDYALPVAAAGLDLRHVSAGFLQAIGPHDLICIAPVREADAEAWQDLLGVAPEGLGFGSHLVVCDGDFNAWRLRHLGAARVAGLARKTRRLSERGTLELAIAGDAMAADALLLAARFRRGRFADDPLQDPAGRAFYAEIAALGAEARTARTYVLSCGGETIGVLFGLVDDGTFRYLVLGCDYARFGRFSPGMILFDLVLAQWFGAGGTAFDFTIGDEAFKAEFGALRASMHRFLRPATPRGAALAASIRDGHLS